jgi:PBP1b-binding outer membrane lipoprotein LpoB
MIRNMKTTIVLLFAVFFYSSCTKDATPVIENVERTIRFVLYTDKDFSQENGNIIFSVVIRGKNNRTIFDSTFSSMKVKDIPNQAHKIVIEKKITVDKQERLGTGFLYTLENVGYSWHLEIAEPGELFKEVNYAFQ